jgi:hypothetical protein
MSMMDVEKARALNDLMNASEARAKAEHGPAKVTFAIRRFKKRAAADPGLWPRLYSQPDPYRWLLENDQVNQS